MKPRQHIPFQNKKSRLDERVQQKFLDSGIATIPCRIGCMNDVISSYSVEGF